MVSDATKKYREIFAYGLLGVAALYFIGGLSLLFKSGDDLGGAGFADKSALFGYVFTHPLLVISLFGAVALATAWEDNSKNAKTIVRSPSGSARCRLLLALICWLAAFGCRHRDRQLRVQRCLRRRQGRRHLPGPGPARLARPGRVLCDDRLPDLPEAGARHSTSRVSGASSRPAGASSKVVGASRVATTRARPSRAGASSRVGTTTSQAAAGLGPAS